MIARDLAVGAGRSWSGLVVLVFAALTVPGCAARPGAGPLPPCGKDVDCKGTRVCERGTCVDATRPPVVAVRPAPATQPAVKPAPSKPPLPVGKPPLAQGRGDSTHQGRLAVDAPATAPKQKWKLATRDAIVAAATQGPDGTIYVAGHDGLLRAIGPDGKERWHFAAEDRSWTTPALTGDGAVQFGSDDDYLYAVEATTGALRWKFRAGACEPRIGFGPVAVRCDVDGGPTIGPDGVIYLGADGVYALNPDGSLRWKVDTAGHVGTAPAVGQSGTVYAGGQDDVFRAIAPDGGVRWELRLKDDIESSPAILADGTVIFGADDGKLYAVGADGVERWALVTLGPVRGSPAIGSDGTIYIGSYDKYLYAVRPDGTVAWRFAAAGRIQGSPVVTHDGTILFGSQDDQVYAVAPDGKLRWFIAEEADVDATPMVLADGTLIICGDDEQVRAYAP
jgi:outer membrane protein assembly factor BamB